MVSLSWKGAGKFKWQNNSEKKRNILSFWSYQLCAFVCALLSQSTFSWQKKTKNCPCIEWKKSLGQILKSWSWWWYMIFMMIVAQYSLKRYTLVEIDSTGFPHLMRISLVRMNTAFFFSKLSINIWLTLRYLINEYTRLTI